MRRKSPGSFPFFVDEVAEEHVVARVEVGRREASISPAQGVLAIWSREYDTAVAGFSEARAIAEETGDRRSIAYSDVGCGLVCALTRSMEEGTAMMRHGVAAFDELGDETGATTGLAAISWVQALTREFGDTDEVFREALDRAEKNGSAVDMGIAEAALAQYRMSRGENERVHDLLGSSLEHLASARHIGSTILTLEVIAELGLGAGLAPDAVSLLGASDAIRSAMGTAVPPVAAARLEGLVGHGREVLGDGFAEAWDRGGTMGFLEASEQGRKLLGLLRGADDEAPPYSTSASARTP